MNVCQGCGVSFIPDRYHPEQKYHDHPCFLRTMNRDPARQGVKGRAGGEVRGQQRKAAAAPGRSYPKIKGRHAHRIVAEQILGRPLQRGEVVHHEDETKTNNDPANLIVFPSQAAHARHHKLGHLGQPCDCSCTRLGEVMP